MCACVYPGEGGGKQSVVVKLEIHSVQLVCRMCSQCLKTSYYVVAFPSLFSYSGVISQANMSLLSSAFGTIILDVTEMPTVEGHEML